MKQFTTRMESDWLSTIEMISHSLSLEVWKENELETSLSKINSTQNSNERRN